MTQPKSIQQVAPDLASFDAYAEVTLTNEETALALLEARQKKYARLKQQEYLKKLREQAKYPSYEAEELMEMVKTHRPGFVVDEFNQDPIWQMCLYFTRDKRCLFDFKKGLLLWGGTGVGKTTLMDFFRFNQTNSFVLVPVREIAQDYQKGGSDAILRHKAMIPSSDIQKSFGQDFLGACFDDLGEEVDKKHFGNESNVMAEILLTRYDRFKKHEDGYCKTHITTNLTTTALQERYGQRVRSRLREMFNVVIFDERGPDRRK